MWIEDVIVKGLNALVECLREFVPFSQISTKLHVEELVNKEIPLKFMEVDEEQDHIIFRNRKTMENSQAHLGIRSIFLGTIQTIKPYDAFINLGGINGLLHVSRINHDCVANVGNILHPSDTMKVIILSHDSESGRVSLSTKKMEPTPDDIIRSPTFLYEKFDQMAQTFRQRIAQVEAMAHVDMLKFQPEGGLTLSSNGVLESKILHVYGIYLEDVFPT